VEPTAKSHRRKKFKGAQQEGEQELGCSLICWWMKTTNVVARFGVVGIAHSHSDPQVVGSNRSTAIFHIIEYQSSVSWDRWFNGVMPTGHDAVRCLLLYSNPLSYLYLPMTDTLWFMALYTAAGRIRLSSIFSHFSCSISLTELSIIYCRAALTSRFHLLLVSLSVFVFAERLNFKINLNLMKRAQDMQEPMESFNNEERRSRTSWIAEHTKKTSQMCTNLIKINALVLNKDSMPPSILVLIPVKI